jgi:hypothetical protein
LNDRPNESPASVIALGTSVSSYFSINDQNFVGRTSFVTREKKPYQEKKKNPQYSYATKQKTPYIQKDHCHHTTKVGFIFYEASDLFVWNEEKGSKQKSKESTAL